MPQQRAGTSSLASDTQTGVVKKFFDRGFGFITPDGGSGRPGEKRDLFVHFSNILMDGYKVLEAGQRVSFEVEETEKGPQAINVVVIEDARRAA